MFAGGARLAALPVSLQVRGQHNRTVERDCYPLGVCMSAGGSDLYRLLGLVA